MHWAYLTIDKTYEVIREDDNTENVIINIKILKKNYQAMLL
jgi:hypothetical protein